VNRDSLLNAAARRRCAKVADELAIPDQFSVSAFCARLEQVTGRETHLLAVRLPPAVGSGIRLSRNDVDYLYYQEQTSPFHQAHIMVGLAARMLLAGPGPVIDVRLTLGLEPQLVRHVLGNGTTTECEDGDADFCAYLVLEGLRPTVSWVVARRLLADLEPLCHDLDLAEPDSGVDEQGAAEPRLYEVVSGILDRLLVLGLPPELRPDGETFADEAVRLAGRSGELSRFVLRRGGSLKGSMTDLGDVAPLADT
jgi:hypothetical protein